MAESKQQTLTQLYSLRAGISAVACERNKVENINGKTDKEVTDLDNEIKRLYKHNEQLEKDINFNKEMLNTEQNSYNRTINRKENLVRPSKSKRNLHAFLRITFVLIPTIILLIVYAYFWVWFVNGGSETDGGVMIATWSSIAVVVLLFGGFSVLSHYVWFLKKPFSNYKYGMKDYLYELKECNEDIDCSLQKIENYNSKISSKNQQISNNNKLITENRTKITQLKTDAEEACVPYYKLGGLIQDQFEKQFNSFLNLRDWRNVDIIIFAYESGRVDNMRDALSYADAETRTDRVVAAINDSSQAVCRSIRSGLYDLAQSMGRCLSVISNQIAVQTKKLDKIAVNMENLSLNTANLAKSAEGYSQSLTSLAAKVNYSNALQKQRNISSAKLVEENEMFMVQARNYMRILDTEVSINGGRIN